MTHPLDDMRHDGAPDVTRLSSRTHTARKAHTLGCGCVVRPGERYGVVVDLVDGKMETYKGHALGWASCPTLYAQEDSPNQAVAPGHNGGSEQDG